MAVDLLARLFRTLEHMLPEEIDDDRVWFETVDGVGRSRAELPAQL